MSDDQAREMRPETTSEHIARDMREGRFPEQSERQMVPVLASLPHEIQVWRSMDTLDHIGTWSTTRYPPEAVTYVPKSDAAAAVALALEEAAKALDERGQQEQVNFGLDRCTQNFYRARNIVRAIAPASGVAKLEALRAERDEWKRLAVAGEITARHMNIVEAERAAANAREAGQAFDKADWFWRAMDPDDCGDSPEEAINRAMVGRFCVCEIASSYAGPTRYGFIAPVLDPESDDEEFVHFATQQEAIDAAKARAALAQPSTEGGA